MIADLLLGLAITGLAGVWMVAAYRQLGLIRAPTLPAVYFFCHVFMLLLPAAGFLFDPARPAARAFFWACVLTAAITPVAAAAADLVMRGGRTWTGPSFFRSPVQVTPDQMRGLSVFLYVAGFFGMLLAIAYIQQMPSYPLKALLSGVSTREINEMRNDARAYIWGMLALSFFPLLFLLTVAAWRHRQGFLFRIFSLSLLATAFFYNSFTTRKTPVAMLFLLWFVLLYGRRAVPQRTVAASGRIRWYAIAAVVGSMIVMYPVFVFKHKASGMDKTVMEIIKFGIVDRVLLKPANNTYYAFEIFPRLELYTDFADLGKVADLMGRPRVDVSTMIALHKGQTEDTNAPPTTIGRFYAQGGWPMVVFGSFLVAFMLQAIQHVFDLRWERKSLFVEAAYVFCLWGAFRLNMGYFYSVVGSEVFAPLLVIAAAYVGVSRLSLIALRQRWFKAPPSAQPPVS